MSKLKTGLGDVVITGDVGLRLAGYANKRQSTGIHDDLHARCLVLETESTAVALLTVSVLSLDAETTNSIRRNAAAVTGIPEDSIVVHSIHTHSAPEVVDNYRDLVHDRCVDCIAATWTDRFDGRIGTGMSQVTEAGKNRRYLDYGGMPVDPDVGIIKVEDRGGNLRGVLFNYACHCTTLGSSSTLMTEDWPHFVGNKIRKDCGDSVTVMFFNGACGDINPGYDAALSAVGAEIPIRTWQEAKRIGERVADSILSELALIATKDQAHLAVSAAHFSLPGRKSFPVTVDEANRRATEAREDLKTVQASDTGSKRRIERAKAKVFLAELLLESAEQFHSGEWKESVSAEIQSILVNDTVITTFPGEVFVEIGLAVKEASPAARTFVVELVNTAQAAGYMPAHSAFAEGNYEAFKSFYAEDAGDVLVAETLQNVKKLLPD